MKDLIEKRIKELEQTRRIYCEKIKQHHDNIHLCRSAVRCIGDVDAIITEYKELLQRAKEK